MRKLNFVGSNDVQLLHCGAEYFPALIADIDQAQQDIYLETYIFSSDPTGLQVQAALERAAQRGVTVRVIADWLGSGDRQSQLLLKTFTGAGVEFRCFNPWFRRGLARTHRKICVIDQKAALVGGLNVNDDMLSDDEAALPLQFPRWDFAVRVTGPLVSQIHLEIYAQWLRLGKLALKSRLQLLLDLREEKQADLREPSLAAFIVRDNLRHRVTIQRAYLQALGLARKKAILANPYFAPGRKFRRALISAAARGVDVTLLIGVGQFHLQDAVAHSYYPKLMKYGVKIVEYRKTQLHAKVAVVDQEWATVGSSNFDGLSLFVNQEANVVIRDAEFARKLTTHLEQGIADGVLIAIDDYNNKSWYKRAWYGTAYLIYRGLMRIVTLGGYA
ncbi:cardiolipin synthase ClsB [Undibacterium sp.]|jgi:cardiolipin synthase|uniref:cardiolipin synthase ClsB n=1 Tax=Undibacterium sp. TaxID=1914977 RepID=UPI002C5096B9|nr:cardiolipin synthase ClsB [Undibacterium sp.]HTD04945.1 cardiolipin synthase ClsB [Undibacterium sp.]